MARDLWGSASIDGLRPMTVFSVLLCVSIALSIVMMVAWRIAAGASRSGFIDAIWSFAVGAAGVAVSVCPFDGSLGPSSRQWMVAALAALWSLRLGFHIAIRTIRGGDDPRYRQLRTTWGTGFQRKLFWFLQLQAAAALFLVIVILVAARRPTPTLSFGDFIGAVIILAALVGEALSDAQLSRFKADPNHKRTVCDIGLWAVSRHPNYFFQWLVWVGYVFIAIDLTGSYPEGWIALVGPALMYWLLVHASGIPPLEAHMLRVRGEDFKIYQSRVNAFWPGPPKFRSETR